MRIDFVFIRLLFADKDLLEKEDLWFLHNLGSPHNNHLASPLPRRYYVNLKSSQYLEVLELEGLGLAVETG